MNILMSHLHLTYVWGSEIWTNTVINELKLRGYTVYIWSPQYSDPYKSCFGLDNCVFVKSEEDLKSVEFDFAILQHLYPLSSNPFWPVIDKVLQNIDNIRVICHSKFGTDESLFINVTLKDAKYFTISKEIYDDFKSKIETSILKQPIDPSWFNLNPTLSGSLSKILYTNHRHKLPLSLVEFCKVNNLQLDHLGQSFLCPDKIQQKFREFDLVIGTGRWIYESMAAGIPCIVGNSTHIY